jgi:N-methylhydantoinase A
MRLDQDAALAALERLGKTMGLTAAQAALGVVALANEHMAQALRVISVERGIDPVDYTLLAFGGAGGLHVCALADALAMRRALVPMHAGVLSALGMLAAPRGRQLSHTLCRPLLQQDDAGLHARLQALAEQGRAELLAEGVGADAVQTAFSLDLRYQGQRFSLNVPYQAIEQALGEFHRAHQQRFGHALDVPVELVNLRVGLSAGGTALEVGEQPADSSSGPFEEARLVGEARPVPVWRRAALGRERSYRGPMLVVDAVATTYVAPGWCVRRVADGGLLLERC